MILIIYLFLNLFFKKEFTCHNFYFFLMIITQLVIKIQMYDIIYFKKSMQFNFIFDNYIQYKNQELGKYLCKTILCYLNLLKIMTFFLLH